MLSETLRRLLSERDLSVASLAKSVDVPRSTINSWINSNSNPDLAQLDKVAQFLGLSIEQLAFGRDESDVVARLFEEAEVHTGVYRLTISKIKESKK
jgi:transcriptional regulator with XRE-family HTH domain